MLMRLLVALGLAGSGAAAPPVSRPAPDMPWFFGGLTAVERQAAAFGVETRLIEAGGRTRRFHLHVPPTAGPGAPLVLALHGGGGNALGFARRIGLGEAAQRHGFAIAAPQGYDWWWSRNGGWNADSTTRLGRAERIEVDDIGFLGRLIDALEAEIGIDPAQVYVMGMSKGGMMAYRLACAMPDRIAAIAAVAATMSTDRCPDGAPVRLLHIHGTEDGNVPLHGGRGPYSAYGADWPEIAGGVDAFCRANRCEASPRTARVAEDTICMTYTGPAGDAVEVCLIDGGGHAWPGSEPTKRQSERGVYVSPHFNATEHIIGFFLNG